MDIKFILAPPAATSSSSILVVERLHPQLLLISRAALLSSTISDGMKFLIKRSFFLIFFCITVYKMYFLIGLTKEELPFKKALQLERDVTDVV